MKLHAIFKNLVLGGMLLTAAVGSTLAQTAAGFPNKPIRIVVPFAAGTTTDQAARYISQHITEQTKLPIIVDNRAGANGFIALQYLLQQPADGYTIVIGTNTTHAANSALFKTWRSWSHCSKRALASTPSAVATPLRAAEVKSSRTWPAWTSCTCPTRPCPWPSLT